MADSCLPARSEETIASPTNVERVLVDVAATGLRAADRADLLHDVGRLLTNRLRAGVAILLVTDGELSPTTVTHPSPQGERVLSDLLTGGGPSQDEWLAALPISTREVLHLPVVPRSLVNDGSSPPVPDDQVNALVVAPIGDHGEIVGTLWVSRDGDSAEFGEGELRVLEQVGRLLGALLDNAQRYSRLQAELGDADSELEDLDRRLGRSAAVTERLAHLVTQRLRGPVASLVGLVDLLASHELDERTREDVTRRLHDRADEASRLLWSLIESSRTVDASAGDPTESDLDDVADWVARLLLPRADLAGATIEVRATGTAPIAPRRTRDLWLSLADAALRCGGEDSKLQLLGSATDDGWRLGVTIRAPRDLPDPSSAPEWDGARHLAATEDMHLTTTRLQDDGWVVVLDSPVAG